MSAARFSERNVIRTLILQGVEIRCHRSGELITLENVEQVEREHAVATALGGENTPWNCFYSLKAEHAKQTYGVGSAGWSDRKMIDKAVRIASGGKKVRQPMPKSNRPITKRVDPWGKEYRAKLEAKS